MKVTDTDSLFTELLGAGNSKSFIARNHKGELIAVDYLNNFYDLDKEKRQILENVWGDKFKHFKLRSRLLDILMALFYIMSAVIFLYGYSEGGWLGILFMIIGPVMMFVSVSVMPDWYKESSDRVKDIGRIYSVLKIRD